MENKMIAYVGVFERGVRDVVSAWGSVYILGNDGAVTRLAEKPTGTKLALLCTSVSWRLSIREGRLRSCHQGISANDRWCPGKLCRTQGTPFMVVMMLLLSLACYTSIYSPTRSSSQPI
ncbi:hypothetical protein HD554DRAFT_1717761 [Boletus coccyginus]|nr:hypothetical protein HD554DRAFT_1717761 [Boletus coccyginus]